MDFLYTLPVWITALAIFFLRICDVSFGTLRTIAVVNGRSRLAVFLGFFEVLIWITAVSQVIASVKSNPVLLIAYAAGFAAGNAVGIRLEKRIAMGSCVIRMISPHKGEEIAEKLRGIGFTVTTFDGMGRDGPRTLIFAMCPRKAAKMVVKTAKSIEPQLFYSVEPASEISLWGTMQPATGWRGVFKKK